MLHTRIIPLLLIVFLTSTFPHSSAFAKSTLKHKVTKRKHSTITPKLQSGWVRTATFEGDINNPNIKTEPFTVGQRWKMDWTTEEGKYASQGSLAVFVTPLNGGDALGQAVAHNGSGSGSSLEYGAGEYYLQIIANQHYVIKVYTHR